MRTVLFFAWFAAVTSVRAQQPPPTETPAVTILFVGNSFTYGGSTKVHSYNAASVTDEPPGEQKVGGIPAIFKKFADEAGLRYEVHVETVGGKDLEFHYTHARPAIAQAKWDIVVLQGYSTEPLPAERGGNPASFVKHAILLEGIIHAVNPAAKVYLYETWAFPFKAYTRENSGPTTPLATMLADLDIGYHRAFAEDKHFETVVPVGVAWAEAEAGAVAQPAPGAHDANKVDLWDADAKHPSVPGSYLCALTLFAGITRFEVSKFGEGEQAARELGIAPETAAKLQKIADQAGKAEPPAWQ